MNKAILLDRDGTLNQDSKEYVKGVDEFCLFNFVPDAIRKMNKNGYKVIVITNQSGLARGYFTEEQLDKMHHKMQHKIEEQGGKIDEIFYCPHHPDDNCNCRKPGIENIEKAAQKFDLKLSHSYFIGDSKKDIEAGDRAGCKTVFVRTGIDDYTREEIQQWSPDPDYIFDNVLEFTKEMIG